MIGLLEFGSMFMENFYRDLCKESGIKFDDFIDKITEDTGYTYSQLKSFWTDGEEVLTAENEKLEEKIIDNYLLIHFDPEKKEIIGFVDTEKTVLTDGFQFYISEKL